MTCIRDGRDEVGRTAPGHLQEQLLASAAKKVCEALDFELRGCPALARTKSISNGREGLLPPTDQQDERNAALDLHLQ